MVKAIDRTEIKLDDTERSRIRWSSTKRGFVVFLEFQDRWSRRGPRPVRPVRTSAVVTRQEALRAGDALPKRYVGPFNGMFLYEVDALGRVLSSEEV